jgi:hypothetical protein
MLGAIPGAMPGELSHLDQHEPRGHVSACGVVHEGIGRESGDVRDVDACSVNVDGLSSSGPAVVTKAW